MSDLLKNKLEHSSSLYNKNLSFFKSREPELYKLFENYRLENTKVEIFENEVGKPEIDILEKGKFKYFGRSTLYCEEEVKKFLNLLHPGLELSAFQVANVESFMFNRVGSKSLKKLATIANRYTDVLPQYPIPNFYPLVVMTGVGLGLQILNLINSAKVNNLIVYERSLDNFVTSFYTIDWEVVYSHFNPDEGTSIQIIISTSDIFNDKVAHLWNELVCYCPQFPFTTFFYNHLNDPDNKKIIDKITSDLTVFLHQWGHYDDEINQYNNAQHNLKLGAKVFTPSKFRLNPDIPIAVVAGGPSLESRIEVLKKHRNELIIISCGSAIGTLAHYDIKPNFHVELESDYLVYEAIKKVTTPEYRKGITLLGAAQLNSLCFSLFDQALIFFKDSTALTQLFISNSEDVMISSTPTCTNAGISVAQSLRTKNILLFGCDFGFSKLENHHATGSIHYEDDLPEAIEDDNNFKKNKLIEEISVKGEKIYTKPMYMTSKKRLEEVIKNLHRVNRNAFNCSDGASIKNASWLDTESTQSFMDKLDSSFDSKEITQKIYEQCKPINKDLLNEKAEYLYQCIESILNTLIKRGKDINNLNDLSRYCFIINNITTRHVRDKMGTVHFFIRGHIWIAISIIYTMSLNLSDDEIKRLFSEYQAWFIKSSQDILKEMRNILFSERTLENDPWIHTTVEVEK